MMDGWLAQMHAKVGENESALSIVEKALANMDDVTGRSWESELHRQRARKFLQHSTQRRLQKLNLISGSLLKWRVVKAPNPWNYAQPQALQNSGGRKEGLMRRARY